jgi:hypothetical protein
MMASRWLRTMLAAAGLAAGLSLATPTFAFDTPPVDTILGERIAVKTPSGDGSLPVATTQDWSRPLLEVTRAVIVVPGAHREAASLFRSAARLAPDTDGTTLVIALQFLIDKDIAAHPTLTADVLRWGHNNWSTGGDATSPAPVSSYDAVDTVFAILSDRSRLPNLKVIVLAGFSGGGWLTQRYAALGRGADVATSRGIAVRYVVGSPASYLYFSDDRPHSVESTECPEFNRWPYGLTGDMPRYVAAAARSSVAAIERRYAELDLVYLVGEADNDPRHWELDTSCAGEAQGPDRYARALNFFRYMQVRDNAVLSQRFWSAPGAGHNPTPVFGSPCGRAALFDTSGCTSG